MCVYVCVCVHICVYMCVYICMYVCIYVCIYICVYMCIYGGRYHDISVAHINMVLHKYLHQWRTQGGAPRICLPPFSKEGPTYIRGAWICSAPLISALCVTHSHFVRHGCGGLTPPGMVLVGAHICVAHPLFGAPCIRWYLWRTSIWCATATYLWSTET
jgi:hypothetical protein